MSAPSGLAVNIIFRWIDSRAHAREVRRNIARIDAEEARAQERRQLEVQSLRARIKALEKNGPPAPAPQEEAA